MPDFAVHAAEVAAAFDLGTVRGQMLPAAGGEQALIWRLDTSSGSFAVKEPRRGTTPRTDGVDIAFQEAVRAQTEVQMPMPVRRLGGGFVVPIGQRLIRVAEWVDLQAPDTGLDPVTIGRLLAALHQVDYAPPSEVLDAGVDPWYRAPVGEPSWVDLIERLAAAGAPFVPTLRDELPHLLALEAILETPERLRMCHCDLWSDNVLRTTTGGVCVIDWDNCGPADPSQELAQLVFEFGGGDQNRMRVLSDAYRAAGGPGRLMRTAQLSMVIAQFGHFWAMAAEEWLDPASADADRAHAEARVAELMAPPFRLADARDVVAAVR